MSEYIHQGNGKLREIKAAGGRRSALNWIWFRRPFHPDCECGESLLLPSNTDTFKTPAH